ERELIARVGVIRPGSAIQREEGVILRRPAEGQYVRAAFERGVLVILDFEVSFAAQGQESGHRLNPAEPQRAVAPPQRITATRLGAGWGQLKADGAGCFGP